MFFSTGAQLEAAITAIPTAQKGSFVPFDAVFYKNNYMVGSDTLSPIDHFVKVGAAQNFKPTAGFDPVYYAAKFSDLNGKGFDSADLLIHFLRFGLNEGRSPNTLLNSFDGAAYLAANTDVAAFVNANLGAFKGSASNGALAHFVKFGAAEGRSATNIGQTFTLTAGTDAGASFSGTAGNDTFSATHLTLNSTDVLVGGAGVDTLFIVDSGTAALTLPAAQVSGIENINVRNVNGTAAVAEVVGVTAVNEQQTVSVAAVQATFAAGTVSFLGIATASVTKGADVAATTAAVIAEILTAKATIIAGPTAQSLGVTDIISAGVGSLTLVFGGANGKGNISNIAASSTNNAVTFGAGAQTVQGVTGVVAVTAALSLGQTDTVNAANFVGATAFTSDNSTGLVNFTGLTAAQSATLNGGAGGMGAGFGTTVTSGTVNIAGGTTAGAVAITGSAITTATINSTGAANTIGALTGAVTTTTSTTINATTALTTGAATNLGATVAVNGAGNVSFGAMVLEAGVTTLNAAGLTGTLTVALGSAVTQTVTGGSGADVISTGAVLTTGTVNGGAGTDVLVLTSAAHIANTTLAAKYTNFETLRLNDALTVDMANAPAGIVTVQTLGAATVSNMTAVQAAAVQMRTNAVAGSADNMAFSLATQTGTADTLTIVAGTGLTTTGALDIGTLNVTGFEVLNIQANAGPTSTTGAAGAGDRTTTVGALTGATLNTINLTGTAVSMSNINTVVAVVINGSALTGDGLAAATQAGLTVAGSAVVGSTITGSAVRDVFTIGAEGSAYNGGAGNDRMITTVAVLLADGVTDGTMNGGDGTDTLVVSNTTTALTDNHFIKLSNFEGLALTNTVGDASVTTGGAFNAAFANGATVTTGTLAATKDIAFDGGLSTVAINITVDATLLTGAATDTNSVITGSAADTITFNTTAATYVGVAGAQGSIVIDARAGNDTITFNHGQLLVSTSVQAASITGGTGADTITKSAGSLNSTSVTSTTVFNMAAGDSGTTIATADKVVGFQTAGVAANTLSDVLNFEGTASVTAFTSSIDFGAILTHSVTGGIVTFDTAATFAAAKVINVTNLADVVGYLNANMGVNETAAFLFDSNADGSNDATMVFHQGSSLTTVADDLVQLVGVTGLSLNATLTTTTAGAIGIA